MGVVSRLREACLSQGSSPKQPDPPACPRTLALAPDNPFKPDPQPETHVSTSKGQTEALLSLIAEAVEDSCTLGLLVFCSLQLRLYLCILVLQSFEVTKETSYAVFKPSHRSYTVWEHRSLLVVLNNAGFVQPRKGPPKAPHWHLTSISLCPGMLHRVLLSRQLMVAQLRYTGKARFCFFSVQALLYTLPVLVSAATRLLLPPASNSHDGRQNGGGLLHDGFACTAAAKPEIMSSFREPVCLCAYEPVLPLCAGPRHLQRQRPECVLTDQAHDGECLS